MNDKKYFNNKSGLQVKYNHDFYKPTQSDIILCTKLARIYIDISDNNFGTKGANVLCEFCNYTILGLNICKLK